MRRLLVIIFLLALEMFIGPKYNFHDGTKILSRTIVHLLGILNSVYSTRDTLKKYNRLLPILIIALNYLFGKFLIVRFYDSGCKYFESMHSLVIIFVTTIAFCFAIDKESLDEYQHRGGLIKNYLHLAFSTVISVNQLFYFFKHFHLKHGNMVDYNFNLEMLIHFIVDFLANNFSYVVNNLLCFQLDPKKRKNPKYLHNILKKFIWMILANVAFYSIYSFQMARWIYETTNAKIPHPHNLIIYNILPKNLDQRFRVFLYIFNWFIFM